MESSARLCSRMSVVMRLAGRRVHSMDLSGLRHPKNCGTTANLTMEKQWVVLSHSVVGWMAVVRAGRLVSPFYARYFCSRL
jgi:hypothetical protein